MLLKNEYPEVNGPDATGLTCTPKGTKRNHPELVTHQEPWSVVLVRIADPTLENNSNPNPTYFGSNLFQNTETDPTTTLLNFMYFPLC